MKVRMKVSMSGTLDGEPYPPAGEVADLPESVAVKMLENGQATHLRAKDEVETRPASTKDVETGDVETVKRGPGRPRKDAG